MYKIFIPIFFILLIYIYNCYIPLLALIKKAEAKLIKNIKNVKNCLLYNNICNCNYKFNDVFLYKHKYFIKTKNIYGRRKEFFPTIISPYFKYVDIIVGIPCSPLQLAGRVAIRYSFGKIKKIDNYRIKYVFVTGLSKSMPFNLGYLREESLLYNDLIVFNMINSYENLTYSMFSFYKWILEEKSYIKFFIRCNLDTLFLPNNLKYILKNNYDIVGEFFLQIKENVTYPQGSFYIFSFNALKKIYNNRLNIKFDRHDDVIYGKIIKSLKNLTVIDIFNSGYMFSQKNWNYNIQRIRNTVAIHPVNPQVLFVLYSLLLNCSIIK